MVKKAEQVGLPKQQLTILALCRLAEPVATSSVNPYLPEMIRSFGVPIDKVAQWSGGLAACFSLSQCLTAIPWGSASDRFGRKPMIIAALTIIMIGSVSFGFSTSLLMAFATRSMQGLASGNVGIIRTAVAEMVPQKELQPKAFSIMPLVWSVGITFGPTIGGTLVRPVEQYPAIFKNFTLLAKFPFAFPNLVIGGFFLIGIASGFLFLRETHEDRKNDRDYGLALGRILTRPCMRRPERPAWKSRTLSNDNEATAFLHDDRGTPLTRHPSKGSTRPTQKKKLKWSDVLNPQSNINLAAYAGLAMHSIAYDQILPVFMNYPTNSQSSDPVVPPFKFTGGFGLGSPSIGVLFTIYGFFGMLIQFLVFPPVAKKFGVLRCFKACAIVYPLVYVLTPFTSLITSNRGRQGTCLAIMLVKCVCTIFSFPCSTILLTNSATSLKILGTLNGVATSVSAVGRAAGPALTGAAFTFGVDVGYVILPFWILAGVAVISAFPIWWLIEMEGFAAKRDEDDEEEVEEEEDSSSLNVDDSDIEPETRTEVVGLGVEGTEEAAALIPDDMLDLSPATSPSQRRL